MEGLVRQWWRLGGLLGIGYVIIFLIAIVAIQGETPMLHDSIDEIRQYFGEDGQQYLIGDYLAGLGFILFFLPFVAILRAFLGYAEGPPAVLSRIALVGGLTAIVLGGAGAFSWGALALGAADDPEVDDAAIRTLMYMSSYSFALLPLAGALFLLPASAVIWRTAVVWRWLALLGLLVAVVGIVGSAWPIDGDDEGPLAVLGFVALIGLNLWVLLTSIAMVMKRELPAEAVVPAARGYA
jgi:hypothetical protein